MGCFGFLGFFSTFLSLSASGDVRYGSFLFLLACADFGFSIGVWFDFGLFLF